MVEPFAARVVERDEQPRDPAQDAVQPATRGGVARRPSDARFRVGAPGAEVVAQAGQRFEDRAEIDFAGRRLLILADRGRDLLDRRGVVERVQRRVEDPHDRRQIHREIAAQDLQVRDRHEIVRRVPRRVAAASADRVVPAPLALFDRDVRQQHVQAGRPDLVEGVVACAQRPDALRGHAERVADRRSAQRVRLRHPHDLLVRRRVGTARGVDVELGDAALVEFVGERVGVPRRSRVAAR